MAARSDAATDRVTLSSAPSMATITIAGWARIEAASAGSFNPIARFYTNSGDASSWIVGFKGANGRTPSVYSPGNTTGISAAEQTLSTYVYVAATLSGTSAQLLYGNTPGSLTKVTGTVAASGTPDRLTFFGRSAADGSEWLNGTLAYWRIWTAVLSDSELAAESLAADPVRTSGLWADWDFAVAALTDGSGNGRNLTAGSTALSSATDPTLGSPTEAGTATITLGASGTQSRSAADAGTSPVTLGASGTQQRVAADAGAAAVTLGAAGTAATQKAAAGTAVLALGAAGSSVRTAADAGTAALVLGLSGAQARAAAASGLAALTLGGDGVAGHVAADAGTAALTLLATGTVDPGAPVDAGTALLTLGAAGVHSTVRTAAGVAALTLLATGVVPADEIPAAGRPRLTVLPNRAALTVCPNQAALAVLPNEARAVL